MTRNQVIKKYNVKAHQHAVTEGVLGGYESDSIKADELIQKINDFAKKHGFSLDQIKIDMEVDSYYDSCTAKVDMEGTRPLTEEEFNSRVNEFLEVEKFKESERKAQKEQAKAREKEDLRKLIKKYGIPNDID